MKIIEMNIAENYEVKYDFIGREYSVGKRQRIIMPQGELEDKIEAFFMKNNVEPLINSDECCSLFYYINEVCVERVCGKRVKRKKDYLVRLISSKEDNLKDLIRIIGLNYQNDSNVLEVNGKLQGELAGLAYQEAHCIK